jgi:Mg2+ and Co2+ transporter CorA
LVFATKVIEGFGQMNTDTPILSLKKASMKLGQVAKENPDQAIVVSAFLCFLKRTLSESIIFKYASKQLPLLKAIEDFNDRIIPNFTTVEKQKQEIEALQKELHRSRRERDLMQTKLRRAESLQTEVVSLRNALSESEANTQEAIRLAEVAKDDLGKVHETSGQWQRRAAELDQENKRFKDMLERHASIVSHPLNLFVSTSFM